MEYLIYTYIFIIWLLFGSFASVIIHRIKNKKSWIITWKSECPKCKHHLEAKELIPIISFIKNKWKCKYCGRKIDFFYPLLEISMRFMFFLTSFFLVDINLITNFDKIEIIRLIFWLFIWFLTIIYVFYDILYLEIPDIIIGIWIIISLIILTIDHFSFLWQNILNFSNQISFTQNELLIIFFYVIISFIFFYIILLKWLSEIYDIMILLSIIIFWIFLKYFLFIDFEQSILWNTFLASSLIFLFFFIQIIISKWRWIWWWDLRIALLMGLLLWLNNIITWILITYITWSIIWTIIVLIKKIKSHYKEKKKILNKIKNILWIKPKKIPIETQIPFWPFLAIWIYLNLFFSNKIEKFFYTILNL